MKHTVVFEGFMDSSSGLNAKIVAPPDGREKKFREWVREELFSRYESRHEFFLDTIQKMSHEHFMWAVEIATQAETAEKTRSALSQSIAPKAKKLLEEKTEEAQRRAEELVLFILAPTETQELGNGAEMASRRALYKNFIPDRQEKIIKKAGSYFGYVVGGISAVAAAGFQLHAGTAKTPAFVVGALKSVSDSALLAHHPLASSFIVAGVAGLGAAILVGMPAFGLAKGAADKTIARVFMGLSVSQATQLLADDPQLARKSYPNHKVDAPLGDLHMAEIEEFEALSRAASPADRVILMGLNKNHSLIGLRLLNSWRENVQSLPEAKGLSLAQALKTARDSNAPPAWANPQLHDLRNLLADKAAQRSAKDMGRAEHAIWLFVKALTADSAGAQKINTMLNRPMFDKQRLAAWRAMQPEERGLIRAPRTSWAT